jgi:hypothetical protein
LSSTKAGILGLACFAAQYSRQAIERRREEIECDGQTVIDEVDD